MGNTIKLAIIVLFFAALNISGFAQTDENIKTSGVKAGIDFPIGDWSSDYGIGFNVGDITKWNITNNIKILGRTELTFIGGTQVSRLLGIYPNQYTYTYNTNPIGIITAGSGIEINLSGDRGFYTMLDLPSLNIIIGTGTGIKAGFGIGLGYELSVGKALFGFEARGNLYNAFLTQSGEKSMAVIQIGFTAEY